MEIASVTSFGVEDGEESIGNILGQLMRLIEQHRNLAIHDKRDMDLVEEPLQIFNCGAVKLKKWSITTIAILQIAAELTRKLCLAQPLGPYQQ